MKNKKIYILAICAIGLLALSSQSITASNLSSNNIVNKPLILGNGKLFIFAKVTGTIDEPLKPNEKFILTGDAKDITIKSLRGTFKIGNDYEGSDFFGIRIFYGEYSPTDIDCIAMIVYVEGL